MTPVPGAPRLRAPEWFVFGLMASVTFVGLLSELIPSGILPQMTEDLGVSESHIGMLVGVYALASAVGTIPLVTATLTVNRKHLLLVLLAGFAISNLVVGLASSYAVMVGARGDLPARLEAGQRAIELAPEWGMAHVYQGDVLCRLGRLEEAWHHYERGFLLEPTAQNQIALALQCLWDRGAIEAHHDRLLELADEHPGTWLGYLARDVVHNGATHRGVDPRYRPRGYNQGPRSEGTRAE